MNIVNKLSISTLVVLALTICTTLATCPPHEEIQKFFKLSSMEKVTEYSKIIEAIHTSEASLNSKKLGPVSQRTKLHNFWILLDKNIHGKKNLEKGKNCLEIIETCQELK